MELELYHLRENNCKEQYLFILTAFIEVLTKHSTLVKYRPMLCKDVMKDEKVGSHRYVVLVFVIYYHANTWSIVFVMCTKHSFAGMSTLYEVVIKKKHSNKKKTFCTLF